MKNLLLVVVFAFALTPAVSLAQNQDGQGGNNNNQGGNSISATEMSEIGVAFATFVGAAAYFSMRRRASQRKN